MRHIYTFAVIILLFGETLCTAELLNGAGATDLVLMPQVHDLYPKESVSISPDGKLLATTEKHRQLIQLWNIDGQLLRQWKENIVFGARFGNLGRFLASFMNHTVSLWDPENGKLLDVYHNPPEHPHIHIEDIAFSSDDRYMAVYGFLWDGTGNAAISIWDIKSRRLISTSFMNVPGQHILRLFFMPGDRYLLVFPGGVFELRNLQGQRISGWEADAVTDCSINRSKNEIACSSKDGITIWSPYGKLLNSFHISATKADRPRTPIKEIAYLTEDTLLTSTKKGFQGWDRNGRLLWEHFQPDGGAERSWMYSLLGTAASPDGNSIVLRTNIGPIEVWDVPARSLKGNFSKHANRSHSFDLFPDDDILTASLRRIDWTGIIKEDLSSKVTCPYIKQIPLLQGSDFREYSYKRKEGLVTGINSRANYILSSPDGTMVAISYVDGYVQLYDKQFNLLKRYPQKVDIVNSSFPPMAFSPDSKKLAIPQYNKVVVVEISSDEILSSIPLGKDGPPMNLQFFPDGRTLLLNSFNGNYKVIDSFTKDTLAVLTPRHSSVYNAAFITKEGIAGIPRFWASSQIFLWDINKGTLPPIITPELPCADIAAYDDNNDLIAVGGNCGTIGILNMSSRKWLKNLSKYQSSVTRIRFSLDGRYLFSSFSDGMIKIWNTANWEEVSLLSDTENEWIIFTPDGYFDASPHGGDLLAMVNGLTAYGIEQFAIRNNRPDLILERMGFGAPEQITYYQLLHKKRIDRLGFTEAMLNSALNVPEANIIKAVRDGKFINIEYELSDSKHPLSRFNIFVNNVPVFGPDGKRIRGRKARGIERVELGVGRNKIELSAVNSAGAESYRAFTYSEYKDKTPGDLYYLAFGVSRYRDSSLNLSYADKDVKDLEIEIQKMEKSYKRIYSRILINSDVTSENLRNAGAFLKDATVDDTVILMIAGHGGHSKGSRPDYYYLPHDADPDSLEKTGIPFEDIEGILADISSRKKILLIDTCESGELEEGVFTQHLALAKERGITARTYRKPARMGGKGEEPRRGYLSERNRFIYNNLARRTGAVVFSSSGGKEMSYESSDIMNGFFTEQVINALSDKTADINADGMISMQELKAYVREAVSNDTGGLQNPSIDRDNLSQEIELPVLITH